MLANLAPMRAISRAGGLLTGRLDWPQMPLAVAVGLAFAAFIGPLLITAVVLDDVSAVAWAVLIADLCALFLFALATFRRPALFIGVMVLWLALQRILAAAIAPDVSGDMIRWLLLYKEGVYMVLVAAGAVLMAARYLAGQRELTVLLLADALAIAFLALLAIAFLLSPADFTPRLTYLRRFAAPVFLYLGGRMLAAEEIELRRALQLTMGVILAVAVFGLVERFLLGVSFWQDGIDATAFYSRQIEAGLIPAGWLFVYRGVPDGVFIALPVEVPVRRLVSTFLEPTTLGSFLAFGLLLALLAPPPGRRGRRVAIAVSLLLALALTATLSRGGMLVAVAGSGFFLAVRALEGWRRFPWRTYAPAMPILGLLGLGILLTTLSFSQTPSLKSRIQDVLETSAVSGLSGNRAVEGQAAAADAPVTGAPDSAEHPPGSTAEGVERHLSGLSSGLDSLRDDPVGSGLGTTGNWSEAPGEGGESMIGTLASQLGVAGFALWLAFVGSSLAALAQVSVRARASGQAVRADILLALAAAFFGLHITSWFSESASGLLGNALYFLFAGWALALAAPVAARPSFRWLPQPLSLRGH